MGQTIVEKVLSRAAGRAAYAGQTVVAQVDAAMSNDASGPLTIEFLERMGLQKVLRPERIAFVIDHYVPCPDAKVAALHDSIYRFAARHGVRVVDPGEGIAHQVFDELGYLKPGGLVVGGDSHSTTYGYLGCVGVGIGSSDMAMVFQSGGLWLRVPETIRVTVTGRPGPGIGGKDIALHLLGRLGPSGANYQSLEFCGEGLGHLDMQERRVICNMLAECCAKCGVMPLDQVALEYCRERGIDTSGGVEPDPDCRYVREITVDLSLIPHLIARPSLPSDCVPLEELAGLPVDMVLLGTCTNGRLEDFRAVHELLLQTSGSFRCQVLAVPASRRVYGEMLREGIAGELLARGAMILPPACGPCCGSSPGVPRDGFVVLSTANRNFLGRMGNTKAAIYLSSPLVAAAAAVTGRITDPKELMG